MPLLFWAVIYPSVCAQPRYPITEEEHIKYWYFRQKLITNFLVIGQEVPYACSAVIDPQNRQYGGCGLSLPVHERYYDQYGYKSYHYAEGAADLGWYIGVLATELRLLYDKSQPYTSTQYELLCALRTYARMDNICEYGAWPNESTTRCDNMNGFFLRDDVDGNLFANNRAFAAKFPDWNNPNISNPYIGLNSSLINTQESGHNSYPSQDQIAHLFMGFALVKRCLENVPVRYYFDESTGLEVDFVGIVQYYTELIADRLMDHYWVGYIEVEGDREPYEMCCEQALDLTYHGIAASAYYITGKNEYLSWFVTNPLGPNFIAGWQVKGEYEGAGAVWMMAKMLNGIDFSVALCLAYAAMADNWLELLPPPLPPNNVTFEALESYGNSFNMEIYALLNHYLHRKNHNQDDISALYPEFEGYIYLARCDGNYNYPLGDVTKPGAFGWRATNRWIRPLKADDGIDPDGNTVYGDFNGLDFMLLYNLYWLVAEGHDGQFSTSYTNRYILDTNNDISTSGIVYLKDGIDLASKIGPHPKNNYADVSVISDTEINLLPGFETENNTDIFMNVINPIVGCDYMSY